MTALARHALKFYDLLAERTKPETINGYDVPIFRGSIVKLWNQIEASNTYYTKVMRNLTDLGCIAVLQRGAGPTESVVAVIRRPEPAEISAGKVLTPTADAAMLRQQVENVVRNIGGIDIADALKQLDKRLTTLEREARQ